jgi:hypothetical protein
VQGKGRPGQRDEQACPCRDALFVTQPIRQVERTPQRAFGFPEPADLVEASGSGQQLRDLVIRDLDGVP